MVVKKLRRLRGGEGGIRTLDGVSAHTPLAGERFQPLSHLSDNNLLFLGFPRLITCVAWKNLLAV